MAHPQAGPGTSDIRTAALVRAVGGKLVCAVGGAPRYVSVCDGHEERQLGGAQPLDVGILERERQKL